VATIAERRPLPDRLVLRQRPLERRQAGGEGAAGEGLEVEEAGVAPRARLLFLDREQPAHVAVARGIDVRDERVPRRLRAMDGVDAGAVPVAELVPQRPA